ncbi:aldehyde dehydrogenase [Rhodoblastus sp.]|uniref:aldehyde dehydrogenase n=1 Tax=Rhodoblastus sp. TaxID=1962975 RepID=UPI0025DF8712|nr:aldehyde dehydrogenase [Rhodoblastus sp.]
MDLQSWKKLARELKPCGDAIINGKAVAAKSGEVFDSLNPATGEVIAQVAACGDVDIDLSVRAARMAFDDGRWSGRSPAERKGVLSKLSQLIVAHRDELALLESLDMGKPIRDALAIDIPGAANAFAWHAEAIDKVYGEIAPTARSSLALVSREPVGVVGAVVPWNFPLLMACWKVAPALATGNSVILKPAEQSSLTAIRLAELALEAGLPEGVFNVTPGYGGVAGKALGLHDDVDCLTFTGSTAVGAMFLEYAARSNLKQVSLETGGKSPHIVFADCSDIERAAQAVAFGIFFNQGEVCNAGSRLLVEAGVKDRLMRGVLAHAAQLQPGDPLDVRTRMGAMVDDRHCDRVMEFIGAGLSEGARIVTGGQRATVAGRGSFIQPTVFDGVTPNMTIAREEIFGPVLSVMTFESEAEAVRLANDSRYGLAADVWTASLDRAHRMARALRSGLVWVNCYDVGDMSVPFGGVKQSGFGGRDRSLHAFDQYTQLKTTWIRINDKAQA